MSQPSSATPSFYRGSGLAEGHPWLVTLCLLAAICAVSAFLYFDNYPALVAGRRNGPALDWSSKALLALFLAAPIIILIALVIPRPWWIAAAKVYAALFTSVLILGLVTGENSKGNPFTALGWIIAFIFFIFLAVELFVIGWALERAQRKRGTSGPRWVFRGLVAALLGGWLVGVITWSVRMPPRVIAAAETAARGDPYCIEVVGQPTRWAGALTPLSMRARSDSGGYTWDVHGLLVVDRTSGREYLNWSYRSNRFEPVSDAVRSGLRLDLGRKCQPRPHFARGWLWL